MKKTLSILTVAAFALSTSFADEVESHEEKAPSTECTTSCDMSATETVAHETTTCESSACETSTESHNDSFADTRDDKSCCETTTETETSDVEVSTSEDVSSEVEAAE